MTADTTTSASYIGCAGWNIPAIHADLFPTGGSHLQRYATRFNAVEINSSFYRFHRPETYRRWAGSVPDAFRFSVKMIKTVTHVRRLRDAEDDVLRFLAQVTELGHKLGCILIQLPPGANYDASTANAFFAMFRRHYAGTAVCEPRHASWFGPAALSMLKRHAIGRVGASPPPFANAEIAISHGAAHYFRLHGTPRIYYDAYPSEVLQQMATRMQTIAAAGERAWCILDNTALGHATSNALELITLLRQTAAPSTTG